VVVGGGLGWGITEFGFGAAKKRRYRRAGGGRGVDGGRSINATYTHKFVHACPARYPIFSQLW
jgi:hypothetical protein